MVQAKKKQAGNNSLNLQRRLDTLSQIRLSGVADPAYSLLYGKSRFTEGGIDEKLGLVHYEECCCCGLVESICPGN